MSLHGPPPGGERAAIERHLRWQGGGYCARPGETAAVSFVRLRQRAAARLYWYRVSAASASRTVVVKVPGGPADAGRPSAPDRPRLVEPPPLAEKYAREHRALDLLQCYFGRLGDARFGFVPLLDRIDPARALVMGEIQGVPLNRRLPRLSRLAPGGAPGSLRRPVENAGAWLRRYHGLAAEGASVRQSTRAEFVGLARRFCEHLEPLVRRPTLFVGLADQVAAAAEGLFPSELPIGPMHGDFAMRNIVVGAGGEVVVFDTTAAWLVPVYADLAKFSLALRTSRPQVYSHGRVFGEEALRRVDGWLFAGYFGDETVPEAQIRLYALLLLLDKWSFELALPGRGSALVDGARRKLLDSWFESQVRDLARWLT